MEQVWRSIDSLCSPLTEAQWKTPTDCPGWSVQDQVSHLVGAESRILGNPGPDHTPKETGHVKNDVGQSNEVVVDYRRSWPGRKVLDEFRELTGQRLALLRSLTDEQFAAETQTPLGPGPVTEFVRIRIFDAWVHQQDMRRALNIPGDLEGPVAAHSVGRVARAMPFVVARKAQAPDGVTVVFDVTGPAGRTVSVGIEERRGRELDSEPPRPTVRITADVETFVCLGCGRWDPAETLRLGKVTINGDAALGENIVNQMNIMI
ncbi:MAG: hypothetical protein BZY87_04115 [SAR202 cluster bacterium Io17-Chloro-G6]|nr:MAG: hypothetical protein BZY87_04115 [SAR202 cluster bacterium Io17-Chloro-G6]